MTTATQTSNDMIDGLVRRYFHVEPAIMASLAHGDEQVHADGGAGWQEQKPDIAEALAVVLARKEDSSIETD